MNGESTGMVGETPPDGVITGQFECSRVVLICCYLFIPSLMFFNSTDLDLIHAKPGPFAITPTPEMEDALKRDYQAMPGMIFEEVPDFADVLEETRQLEQVINQVI